jgi:hypothetical protein
MKLRHSKRIRNLLNKLNLKIKGVKTSKTRIKIFKKKLLNVINFMLCAMLLVTLPHEHIPAYEQ